jgi:hypothetical protein
MPPKLERFARYHANDKTTVTARVITMVPRVHTRGMDRKVGIDEALADGRSEIEVLGNCAPGWCTIVSPIS